MKRQIVLMAFLLILFNGLAYGEERKALKPGEQVSLLSKRIPGSMIGTFDSYCSLLFAVQNVAIHTDSKEVNQTSLHSPFPKFYKPTRRELFDSIARQTKSSLKYDPKRTTVPL